MDLGSEKARLDKIVSDFTLNTAQGISASMDESVHLRTEEQRERDERDVQMRDALVSLARLAADEKEARGKAEADSAAKHRETMGIARSSVLWARIAGVASIAAIVLAVILA